MDGKLKTPMQLREIIVITDGRSNIGDSPAGAARIAHRKGIIVNTIGITDSDGAEEPFVELDGIARAGGGICDIIPLPRLGYSVQMVTRQSIQMTIERAVSRQLQKITGYSMEDIPPDSRARVLEYIQRLGDEVDLKCVVALDCSGSMKNKIRTAKNSIQDLLISLKARKGRSYLGMVAFPGGDGRDSRVVSTFTDNFEELAVKLEGIKAGGPTPTYAGIMLSSRLFEEDNLGLYPAEMIAQRQIEAGEHLPQGGNENPFIL